MTRLLTEHQHSFVVGGPTYGPPPYFERDDLSHTAFVRVRLEALAGWVPTVEHPEVVHYESDRQEILRPIRKRDAGEAIANARIKEESKAEALLKEMEKLDTSSPEFDRKLSELKTEVEKHAEAEEPKEFPRVAKKESPQRREQLGQAYEAAKSLAPTRPHPLTPNTPVANLLIGPFAAVIDRARERVL